MEQKTVIPGMPTVIPWTYSGTRKSGPLTSNFSTSFGLTLASSAPARNWRRNGIISSRKWLPSTLISSLLQITNLQQHV
uniref:Uncharacterized protein n=1 Tax=Bos mutus grunniens TaxID=30521 RepID=A0A8B9Z5F3_BOSMU